jgi:WD40 repeat protein
VRDAYSGKQRSRLITLLGMGGMGKTALSVKLAEQLQGEFEYVIWRSLRHAPFFHDKLTECIKIFSGHQHWVKAIAFSPEGQRLVSGSFDQTVKLWDLRTGVWMCVMTLLGHTGFVTSVAFSLKEDRVASSSYDQTVKIWDVHSGECDVKGLTEAEMSTLKALGAIEVNSSCSIAVNFR